MRASTGAACALCAAANRCLVLSIVSVAFGASAKAASLKCLVRRMRVDFYEQCYRYYALGEAPFIPVEETREVMRVLDLCRKDAARDS